VLRASTDSTVELTLTWGEGPTAHVLATAYLAPGARFVLGEAPGCDAIVPVDALGALQADVVRWETLAGGEAAPFAIAPPSARVGVWVDGEAVAITPGPILLTTPVVVRASFGGFSLRARLVSRDEPEDEVRRAPPFDRRTLGTIALSAALHATAFTIFALASSAPEQTARDALTTRQRLLAASAAREAESPPPPPSRAWAQEVSRRRASAGAPLDVPRPPLPSRVPSADQGGPELLAPSAARTAAIAGVGKDGFIALLRGLKADAEKSKPWTDALAAIGTDDAHGAHAQALFGAESAASAGVGDLRLSGTGLGGGGKVGSGGELKGMLGGLTTDIVKDQIHAMDPDGIGFSRVRDTRGRLERHPPPPPRIPRHVIDGIVRANGQRFEMCLAMGQRTNPRLAGRVDVSFVIGVDGQVTAARDVGGVLADDRVRQCVVRIFFGLTFPRPPSGGTQDVTYPMSLGSLASSDADDSH
jgi:hypothetical protein